MKRQGQIQGGGGICQLSGYISGNSWFLHCGLSGMRIAHPWAEQRIEVSSALRPI